MIKISFFFFVILGICFKSQSQVINKKPLYIFFENDSSNKVSKRPLSLKNSKSGKNFKYELYDFFYTAEQNRHYQFVNKPTVIPKIVDSRYIKLIKPKSLVWLKELKEPLPSTFYKDFPYKKVFLVEKLKINQYKIIEIESFMGKDF